MNLDQAHIASAAGFAARRLVTDGVAKVRLTPGDLTEYPILIAGPSVEWGCRNGRIAEHYSGEYWVAVCSGFGSGHLWDPETHVAPGYAAEKWTAPGVGDGTRGWTGWVMAEFLTAVADALHAHWGVRS
jgi:hypothetical protein